jgi:hypothetical protein
MELQFTICEARDICAILRAKAGAERDDAVGKIHNAKISRLDEAARLEALADRFEAWAHSEQERHNARQSAGVRKFMAARKAARSS